jgi:hypothetical protein
MIHEAEHLARTTVMRSQIVKLEMELLAVKHSLRLTRCVLIGVVLGGVLIVLLG